MTAGETTQRWVARPVQAWLIRVFVFLVPIAGSVLFVHEASGLVAVPTSSFLLFISWWVVMSGAATVVLVAIERAARRLLPLVALYRLSLVFPDAAPSRFRAAMRSNTVETLEQRVARAKALNDRSTPVEAAERLLALVAELDSHDRLTRGHSDRVRAYAQMIGKELHLSPHELDSLNWAALLHDIGKLNVPTGILTRPGQPTADEWKVLRRHPDFGETLIAPLREWLGEWSRAVIQHHERWDGKGYPKGISGEEIGLAARIVAVADVFDVLTSVRSYKSASAATAARDEIARCAGTQFDPRVVRAFLNISLGRLRLLMGPLSWLAHVPVLGRLPLTPAIGTVTASVATVAAALATGLVATPPTPGLASTVPTPTSGVAHPLERVMREDESILVGVEQAGGGSKVISLRVITQPSVGRVRVTADHKLVYTPPPDFSGKISVDYEACWSGRSCERGVLIVSVVPVDDPPVARNDLATTGRGRPVSIDVLANDSDLEGDPLSILSFSNLRVGQARIVGERIRWSPPPKFLGTTSFRYTAADSLGGRASALVTVRVTGAGNTPPPPAPPEQPHPDEPQARIDRLSVPEGGTVVVDVLANDSDPDGDPLSIVSIGSPAHGTAQRVGDRIQFIAPSDYVGQVTFPYTIVDSQGSRDSSSVSVSVLLVNAPPSFTAGPKQVLLEDTGSQTVPGWAGSIGAGASSEAGQALSFAVDNDDNSLFSAPPRIDSAGTLRHTPAPNANGAATVTVRAKDDGGTANGGADASAPQTFTITIEPVNDPPSFTVGADQTSSENAGAQSVASWAVNVEAGPPNELGQNVDFVLSTSDPALFTAGGQPQVAQDGTLSYTPAANANGGATVTIRARDDGGTAGGGDDTSPSQAFTITIDASNDPPSFTPGPDQTLLEDAGPQTVAPWATNISPGAPNESAQTVSFFLSNDNNSLFSAQPSIAANGTLSYTAAPNANGSATVIVRANDDGGSANGGTNSSAAQTFTITVTPVNDPPVVNADGITVAEDDPAGVTFNILANDTDVDAGDTLSVSSYDSSTISYGALTDNGGGTFAYIPDPGFAGTETFTYVAADGSGASASTTVTITVAPVQHMPAAGNDAYTTQQDTPLVVTAPGILLNDGDQDGDAITIQTTAISGTSSGVVTIASDGSFVYSPNSGFSGTDSFTYRIDDGTGRSADGNVTIAVTSSPTLPSTLYFQSTGPSADVWDMTLAPAPAGPPLSDFGGDGNPGRTIKQSNGDEATVDSRRYHIWTYTAPSPLLLNGPVTLDLWSSTGAFATLKSGTLYAYLYDCTPGGTGNPVWSGCTRIAANAVFKSPWNTSMIDWGYRLVTIGSVSRAIPAGNEIRVKLLFNSHDLWLTMLAAYPTALLVTLG